MAYGICYTAIEGNKPGERIGMIRFPEEGYYPTGIDVHSSTLEEAKSLVNDLNNTIGVPQDVAESMRDGSLFGWNVPAAARAIEYWQSKDSSSEVPTAQAALEALTAVHEANERREITLPTKIATLVWGVLLEAHGGNMEALKVGEPA